MSSNPLQQHFRQPKIFISLPSRGVFNKPGTIDGDPANMPVYGMTGMDEIIIKTPDALMSGESSVKVIQSCCPNIKDAWEVSVLDTEIIFAAIRIATYGSSLGVVHTCGKCSAENEYDLDLGKVIEHYSRCQYNNKIVVGDLIIRTQPLTYRQITELNIKNFELQQQLGQAETVENAEEKQKVINGLWEQLAASQKKLYSYTIEAVETPEQVVSERGFIIEWLANCDKEIIDAIKKHIEANRDMWSMPLFPVKCDSCGQETNLTVELDQTNFFVQA